jgi:antitoxin HicB
MKDNPYTGSSFDDFLQEEGLYEECSAMPSASYAIAIKRVLARQLTEEMKRQNLTKTEMAKQMQTSRAQLDRLLDPEKTGVSIETITRAASIVGRQLRIELV